MIPALIDTDPGIDDALALLLAWGSPELAVEAVTTPRFLADRVVTEFGAARLRGLGARERATALAAVAHPRFREELERSATS